MAYDFKSESDVKEFLHNLGIEYRFGCYSEKNPEVCHLLGDFLEAVKKDFKKASKVYKSNCDDYNFPRSCLKYGTYSLFGKGDEKPDYKRAYSYFEKACKMDNADACFSQGMMHVVSTNTSGIEENPHKAVSLMDKACFGNNANACYYVSGMLISGVKKPQKDDEKVDDALQKQEYLMPKDLTKAFKYTVQGCNLGNIYCCANLSQMYARGEGVEKNQELADKYKKIALEMQSEMLDNKTLTFQEGL